MKIRGACNLVFEIDIKDNNFYDVYVNGEIWCRGMNGAVLMRRLKHIYPIDLIFYQKNSDIYIFQYKKNEEMR